VAMRLALTFVVACGLLVCTSSESTEYGNAQQQHADLGAGVEPLPPQKTPIRYWQDGGLNRIDLDDEAADDETYRAFQLARYTGEANEMVAKHEHDFLRKRREEMERDTDVLLGEHNTETGDNKENFKNDAASREWNLQHDKQSQREAKPVSSREAEIMGSGEGKETSTDLGESNSVEPASSSDLGEGTREPFDAIHVPKAGDIEDHDFHFVMTDELRHSELKNAVLNKPEKAEEALSQNLAEKMIQEQQQINQFRKRQAAKDTKDLRHLEVEEDLGEALRRHHLQRDAKGRIVPNF